MSFFSQKICHIANYILTLQSFLTNSNNMTIFNLLYKGILAYSENKDITISHFSLGKYQVITYNYKNYKTRVVKYTNIHELFQDFRNRLFYLSNKKGRNILYTEYGKQCIKNWYKIING